MEGLKEIIGTRSHDNDIKIDPADVTVVDPKNSSATPVKGDGLTKLAGAAADNMPRILSIAESIVELKKIQIQSDAVINQMQEQRRLLMAEAEAYAIRKNADTNDVVQKMNVVRGMMNDFYLQSGSSNISSQDFRMIISDIVENMGKVQNG
jgi:hypothetical protein